MKLARPAMLFPLLTLLGISPAQAQKDLPLWELGIGMATLARPDYPGADEESLYTLPFPTFVYRGDIIRADDKGIKGMLFDSERVELDISGGGSLPVNSSDNGERRELPDLDPAFELGPSLTYKVLEKHDRLLTASLKWRALVSMDFPDMSYQGWVLNPELEWHQQLGGRFEYGASIESLYGNAAYHEFYYGISPSHASASLPAYSGRRGHHSYTSSLFVKYKPGKDWVVRSRIGYMNLDGAEFDDSPLFKQDHGLYFSLVITKILFKSCTKNCR